MDSPKRILILTADAGFGHRSAALAVELALRHLHPEAQVDVVNPLEDRRAPALLRDSQSDYDKIVRNAPELYHFGYAASDAALPTTLVESALIVMLFEVMRDLLERYRPDAVVSTYPLYQAALDAVLIMQRRSLPLLAVVTDLATVHRLWFSPAATRLIVPTDAVYQLALSAGIKPECLAITGIPVHPQIALEQRPPEEIRAELGWQPGLAALLVVGSRRVTNLDALLHVVNHSGLPVQLALVAGGDEELYRQFAETGWHCPVQIYRFVENMHALMRASDAVMCKAGGLIVTESLASGLPLLLTSAIPGQETGNADFVTLNGAGAMVEEPLVLLETLYHWLDNDRALLREYASNARRLGRPHAAFEVAEMAWQDAHEAPTLRRRSQQVRVSLANLLDRFGIPTRDLALDHPRKLPLDKRRTGED